MSIKKTPHDHLDAHKHAAKHIELNELVIEILEKLDSLASTHCIAILRKDQRVQLKKLDRAAKALGVSYGRKL